MKAELRRPGADLLRWVEGYQRKTFREGKQPPAKGMDLAGMDFSDLDLVSMAFEDSTLDGTCLQRAQFGDVYLLSCSVRQADFTDAWLSKGEVHESDLGGAIFRRAKLIKWNVYESVLQNADFTEADTNRTFFCECDLRNARFRRVELIDVGIRDCILTGADFTGSAGTISAHPINVGTPEMPRWIEGDDALDWFRAAGARDVRWRSRRRG